MKKIFYSAIILVMAAFTLASCEDVPMPYAMPTENNGGNNTEGYYINETFATSFGTFTLKSIEGTPWSINYQTATATGYDSASKLTTASKSYLVSSEIDLSKSDSAYVQFDYIYRYGGRAGAEDKVLITDNYTGDPTTTTWTDITGTLTEGADWTTFTTYSKDVPTQFLGKNKVVVALYYACTTSSATWEVKNFVMKDGKAKTTGTNTGGGGNNNTGTVSGTGTATDPFNIAGVTAEAQKLSSGQSSASQVYFKGKVVSIKEITDATSYGNATFYLSDDGTTTGQFYVYRALGLNNQKITSTDLIKVGDEVIVCGTLTNYNGTLETASNGAYIVSVNASGNTGGNTGSSEGVTINGTTVTLTNSAVNAGTETLDIVVNDLNIADKAVATGTYTLTDGTKLTIGQGDGKTAPTYYQATNGFRIYADNTILFECKKPIAKIVMTCDSYNGTDYVGNSIATVAFSGNNATYVNYFTTNSGGVQLRPQKFTITFAQ